MKIIFYLVLLSFISVKGQDDDILKLFPGKWKTEIDKADVFEEWEIQNESELIGIGYSIEDGERILNETIYLKKFADQWAYVSIPNNQMITLFALTEFSQNKFIFENGEHDFPQRIIYEFTTDGKLNAAIEGMVDGELKKREFSFIRID